MLGRRRGLFGGAPGHSSHNSDGGGPVSKECREIWDASAMTSSITPEWERRNAALWAAINDCEPADFRAKIAALAAELPEGDPVALFERASSNDSTGLGEDAVP